MQQAVALKQTNDADVGVALKGDTGGAQKSEYSTMRVHRAFLAAHGPAPFAGYPSLDGHKDRTTENEAEASRNSTENG